MPAFSDSNFESDESSFWENKRLTPEEEKIRAKNMYKQDLKNQKYIRRLEADLKQNAINNPLINNRYPVVEGEVRINEKDIENFEKEEGVEEEHLKRELGFGNLYHEFKDDEFKPTKKKKWYNRIGSLLKFPISRKPNEVKMSKITGNYSRQVDDKYASDQEERKKLNIKDTDYDPTHTYYFSKNKNGEYYILAIQKEKEDNKKYYSPKDKNEAYGRFKVEILDKVKWHPKEAKQPFYKYEDLRATYPILQVIPMKKEYIHIHTGEKYTEKPSSMIDIIEREVPDYESLGLEQPQLIGGKKSRRNKTKKSRRNKTKKSRRNKTKKSRKV